MTEQQMKLLSSEDDYWKERAVKAEARCARLEKVLTAAQQFEMATRHIDLSKIPAGHVVHDHAVVISGEMIAMLRAAITDSPTPPPQLNN